MGGGGLGTKLPPVCCPLTDAHIPAPFPRLIDRVTPADLAIHLVCDNYTPHQHPGAQAWLAQSQRFRLHFTPTHASSPYQVERWFALLSQRAIKRSTFRSVKELKHRIMAITETYNQSANRSHGW